MYCTKCGNEITESQAYCSRCGEKINSNDEAEISLDYDIPINPTRYSEEPREVQQEKPRKKGHGLRVFIIILIIIAILVGCGAAYYVFSVSDLDEIPIIKESAISEVIPKTGTDKFAEEIEDGNYADAITTAEGLIGNINDEQEMADFMEKYLDTAIEDYSTGNCTESEYKAKYDTVEKVNESIHLIDEKMADIGYSYYTISISKQAFSNAEDSFEKENYTEAAVCYDSVAEEDKENYDNSFSKKVDAIKAFEKKLFADLDNNETEEMYASKTDDLSKINNSINNRNEEIENILKALNEKYSKRYEQFILGKVNSMVTSKDYSGAEVYITSTKDLRGRIKNLTGYDFASVDEKQKDIEVSVHQEGNKKAIKAAEEKANNGDYLGAVEELRVALIQYGANADIDVLINKYEEAYVYNAIISSIQAYKADGYNSALGIINDCINNYMSTEALEYYRNLYASCEPVYLSDMVEVTSPNSFFCASDSDKYGNKYSRVLDLEATCSKIDEVYMLVNLGKEYDVLVGDLFVPHSNSNDNGKMTMSFYADNAKVKDESMGQLDQARQISVNIGRCDNLKIAGFSEGSNGCCNIHLGNAYLYKVLKDSELNKYVK